MTLIVSLPEPEKTWAEFIKDRGNKWATPSISARKLSPSSPMSMTLCIRPMIDVLALSSNFEVFFPETSVWLGTSVT